MGVIHHLRLLYDLANYSHHLLTYNIPQIYATSVFNRFGIILLLKFDFST